MIALDFIQKDPEYYLKLYKYKDKYYDERQVVKFIKEWELGNRTKYTILRSPHRWDELEAAGIEPHFAARLFEKHWILDNGDVLTNTYALTANNPARVRVLENGVLKDYYRASLVYQAFIDENFNIEKDTVWFLDSNTNNCRLDNIQKTNRKGKKSGETYKAKNYVPKAAYKQPLSPAEERMKQLKIAETKAANEAYQKQREQAAKAAKVEIPVREINRNPVVKTEATPRRVREEIDISKL